MALNVVWSQQASRLLPAWSALAAASCTGWTAVHSGGSALLASSILIVTSLA